MWCGVDVVVAISDLLISSFATLRHLTFKLACCREEQEITVQEPRTVTESRTIRVPVYSHANGYQTYGMGEMLPQSSAPPTDPNLVFQQSADDAISA